MAASEERALTERITAALRREVRSWWHQSGQPFGKAEPPSPTPIVHLRVARTLTITTEQFPDTSWTLAWDGSDRSLADFIETVAEEYWGEYVTRTYSSRRYISEHSPGDWWAECRVCEAWVSTSNATRRIAEEKFGRHWQNDHLGGGTTRT
jgi:hypothetical protein